MKRAYVEDKTEMISTYHKDYDNVQQAICPLGFPQSQATQ